MTRPGALLLVVVWCAGCGKQVPAGAAPAAPREVVLVPVATIGLPREVLVSGVLAAQEELVLGFQVAGRLQELRVDVGDTVAAGDPLAALDLREFELAHARARASVTAARARLGLASDGDAAGLDVEATAKVREGRAVLADSELKRERTRSLAAENLAPPADLEAAEAACEVARSRLQAAREEVRTWVAELQQRAVDLEQAQKNLGDARLWAPWPGRVAMRRASAGQFVPAGSAVLTLLRIDPLRLRLPVPERQAALVQPGQPVRFQVDGSSGPERAGTVQRLAPAIDRVTRTLAVEAVVENGDGALRPGGFCRARIVVAESQPVLAVPRAAVVTFAGVERVFTVEGLKAQERLVETGRSHGEMVEIVKGLGAELRVVADGRGLYTGAPVAVKG